VALAIWMAGKGGDTLTIRMEISDRFHYDLPQSVDDIRPDYRFDVSGAGTKLIKIGAKVVSHGRYVTFQLAEVAVPRELFRKILSLIDDLRPRPAPA